MNRFDSTSSATAAWTWMPGIRPPANGVSNTSKRPAPVTPTNTILSLEDGGSTSGFVPDAAAPRNRTDRRTRSRDTAGSRDPARSAGPRKLIEPPLVGGHAVGAPDVRASRAASRGRRASGRRASRRTASGGDPCGAQRRRRARARAARRRRDRTNGTVCRSGPSGSSTNRLWPNPADGCRQVRIRREDHATLDDARRLQARIPDREWRRHVGVALVRGVGQQSSRCRPCAPPRQAPRPTRRRSTWIRRTGKPSAVSGSAKLTS